MAVRTRRPEARLDPETDERINRAAAVTQDRNGDGAGRRCPDAPMPRCRYLQRGQLHHIDRLGDAA